MVSKSVGGCGLVVRGWVGVFAQGIFEEVGVD